MALGVSMFWCGVRSWLRWSDRDFGEFECRCCGVALSVSRLFVAVLR